MPQRKVEGSIPDEVTGLFCNIPNPSGRAMAPRFNQTLTEMSAREIFLGVKRGLTSPPTLSRLSRK
jgi:hypothetical protein